MGGMEEDTVWYLEWKTREREREKETAAGLVQGILESESIG